MIVVITICVLTLRLCSTVFWTSRLWINGYRGGALVAYFLFGWADIALDCLHRHRASFVAYMLWMTIGFILGWPRGGPPRRRKRKPKAEERKSESFLPRVLQPSFT